MLTPQEKLLITSFIPSSAFQLLKKIIQERIWVIQSENPEKENQFKTILKVGEQKGGIKELEGLITTLENYYRKSRE